jgi:hypothetical protein
LEPGENNNGWIRADCARAVYDHSRKALIIMSDEYNQSYYKKIDGDLTDL